MVGTHDLRKVHRGSVVRATAKVGSRADASVASRSYSKEHGGRLTTLVIHVLCSGEPLTTTQGGSIVILKRENLRQGDCK